MQLPTIYPVTSHTDHVGLGSTFVAVKGMKDDGIYHIETALAKGAARILVQHDAELTATVLQAIAVHNAQLMRVADTRLALAQESARAFKYPARKLRIIAITGTKGKTTTAFLLEHLFKTADYKTALLSTVHNRIIDTIFPTTLTTPQPDYLHAFLDVCVQQGVDLVILEAAAQGFSLHRLATLAFDGAIFTNFSKEHGEFYAMQEDYFKAKCVLFNQMKPGVPAFINADDDGLNSFINSVSNVPLKTFGRHQGQVKAQLVTSDFNGLTLALDYTHKQTIFNCPILLGAFSFYNLLAALCIADQFGLDENKVHVALATFEGVPGRLHLKNAFNLPNGAHAFIDYAHNPASYEAVLSTLRSLTPHLIVVFGCGGDRAKEKRPIMGTIAATHCDAVILTSDNPRSEDPAVIAQAVYAGITHSKKSKIIIELDREKAIQKAYQLSTSKSIIVLLGKGPDEYQLVNGVKMPFSEREILQAL